jgi:soluble lytic murein transglycosylase
LSIRTFIICCAAVLLVSQTANADIYRYVDERGVVSFTDNPRHSGYRIYLRETSTGPRRIQMKYYPYRTVVREACSIYNLEEPLLRAVMEVESDYNRYAVSSAGARGLMQLMPETMVYVGVGNPWDPKQNIMGGAKYLKELIKRFSGDLPLALAAYNAGPNAVIKYGKVPPYPQTERYVMKVMDRYYRYTGFNN